MAYVGEVSEVYDKNGDYGDIVAKKFDGNRTVKLTGDVTAQQSWGGAPDPDSSTPSLGLSTTIANGAVTESKIATDAVTNAKVKDGELTKAKFNASVYNEADGSIADGTNSNLATKTQVKAYVESVIAGEGHYKGVQSVATINTWTASNLHNGDRVITSDDGTLTLGNLPVVEGQECIFYVSDDQSVKIWQSSEGNYKIKQTARTDPTADGTTITAIDTIVQNANGEISATKKTIRSATTSQTGVVQIAGSIAATVGSENNKAASEKAVRDAINALDVSIVGGDGKIISAISETDGKISATAKTMDSAPTEGHTDTTVTSAGIKAAIDAISTETSSEAEVTAAALDNLDARLREVETRNPDVLGDAVADSLNAQTLQIAGNDVSELIAGKTDKVSGATNGNLSKLDSNGNLVDSGISASAVSTAISAAGSAVQSVTGSGAISVTTSGTTASVSVADASDSAKGVVQFMTSAEAALLWSNAWAAASAT